MVKWLYWKLYSLSKISFSFVYCTPTHTSLADTESNKKTCKLFEFHFQLFPPLFESSAMIIQYDERKRRCVSVYIFSPLNYSSGWTLSVKGSKENCEFSYNRLKFVPIIVCNVQKREEKKIESKNWRKESGL